MLRTVASHRCAFKRQDAVMVKLVVRRTTKPLSSSLISGPTRSLWCWQASNHQRSFFLSDVLGSPRHKMPLLVAPFISVQSGVLVLPFVSRPCLQVETMSRDSDPITMKLFDVLPGHNLCVGTIYMLYTINQPRLSSVDGIYRPSILFVI